jgi:hypothetical protein
LISVVVICGFGAVNTYHASTPPEKTECKTPTGVRIKWSLSLIISFTSNRLKGKKELI